MPMLGEITIALRLKIPVKRAKTVASMFGGVILAKRTRTGIWLKAVDKVSVTMLDKITNARSLIPSDKLRRVAKIKLMKPPTTPIMLFHSINYLTSCCLK